jgi:hypothetical protein
VELGLLLLGFAAYLFFPHVLFKVCAERYVDLGRKFDNSEIEEVVAASIPSALLNFETWIVVRLVGLIGGHRLSFPRADWKLVASIFFSDDGAKQLAELADSPRAWYPIAYFAFLCGITAINGLAYGKGALLGTYVESTRRARQYLPRTRWQMVKFWSSVVAYSAWKVVYREYHVELFPLSVAQAHVYLRTIDSLIYHGRFVGYTKTSRGEIDTIRLESVTRFSRRFEKLVKAGKNPFHKLEGTLHVKWSRVADFNTVPAYALRDLQQRLTGRGVKIEREANSATVALRR